jgi:hypothetical protein
VLVDGDVVVVRWIFRFEGHDGRVRELEELAYQRWDGERIAQEEFFYDPAQFGWRDPAEPAQGARAARRCRHRCARRRQTCRRAAALFEHCVCRFRTSGIDSRRRREAVADATLCRTGVCRV